MNIIALLGIILICGYFFGLVSERLGLPRITAYILAGVLFSNELLGQVFQIEMEFWSDLFTQICLGFIAFIVGGEIHLDKLKKNTSLIFWSTFFSSFLPVIFVFASFYLMASFLGINNTVAFIFAAISSSTDPAATLAVIEQYKIKGEMSDTALGIVALDDAFGIIIFVLILTFFIPNGAENPWELLYREIFFSSLLGAIMGYALSKSAKLSTSNDFLLPLLSGLTLLAIGLSEYFHLSALMVCIVMGFVSNSSNVKESERISLLLPIQHIKELIFIFFFTFAGTHFSFHYFKLASLVILCYLIFRALGKYIGSFLGAKIGKVKNDKIPATLGLTLLPQAGVAIGLIIQVVNNPSVAPYKKLIFNTILGSTIIYEIFGPVIAKWAFRKAGEMEVSL
jgi:NhaP-type Na+/H+ or K+/H+ antiporter